MIRGQLLDQKILKISPKKIIKNGKKIRKIH